MSVAENIFLGDKTGRGLLVDTKVMVQRAREVFTQFNIEIDPDALVRDLPSAQQQIVEIAKAVSKNVRLLIMDEPTAPLTVSEVESMFEIVRRLEAERRDHHLHLAPLGGDLQDRGQGQRPARWALHRHAATARRRTARN